ncbi:hypothetical protein ACOSQ3_003595 [Xanthoceras sorbifolium]
MAKNEHQSGYCSIEINKLEEILEPAEDCCIYRVPQFLRKINEEAYTPRLISIGPLHYHGREELMGMETQKKRYFTKFSKRVGEEELKEFENHIMNQEQYIRDHYAVSSTLESPEYVTMILYDAVFIVELFMRNNEPNTDDFLLDKSQMRTYIMLDLLLLENQLPYFILNELYASAIPRRANTPSFFDLCLKFFSSLDMFNWSFSEQPQVKHFTDFLRRAVVLEIQPPNQKDGQISDLPSAVKLNESGLEFKKKIDGKCLLDISLAKINRGMRLQDTEVYIPCIQIYDDTETLFRNLMALELFHYPTQTYVCHYADLMDYLIDTAKDVELLAENGIIANCLGENEAIAKMFNRLCSRITPSPSCYFGIADDMKTHYNNRWNHAKATLRSVYFPNLWTGTATVAAVVLLILTVIQTVCSLMQV